jgi:hypothetical protein
MAHRIPLLLLSLLAAACGGAGVDGGTTTVPVTTCPVSPAVALPQFQRDILPVLQGSCGSLATSCHGTPPMGGHISYATGASRTIADVWNDLTTFPPNAPAGYMLIVPGDVAHSWLVEKVTKDQPGGAGYGARMPYAAPNLCADTVATIENWINRGAPND